MTPRAFFDPNTQENLTYLQLVERCIMDPVTGLSLLVIVKKGEFYFFVDEATKLILKSTTTTKAGGKYLGKTVSLWDLLYSKYITEEKRRELVQQYKSGSITIERFLEIILTIIQQQTTTTWSSSTSVTAQLPETKVDSSTTETTITTTTITETSQDQKFHGIRKDVTATELLKSKIINEDLYKDLSAGKVTVSEVSEMDTVRRYLEGTNSIAGVYLQSTKETLSIYEAKSRSLLTPGTSLVLLEAQAATGFVIDPVKNKKLSVEEAVAKGVVGTQIATGGIIDPVYSHRVPVQVAYERGYFDEDMNKILSDPDDDTKGFFDPNTQENLTYLQLVERCIMDPVTGLSLLVIVKKGEFYFFVDEATKLILKSTTTTKAGGKYLGKTVSLWDLLYSKYITEEKRRELVQQYKSGSITIERFLEIILTIIQQQTTTTWSSSTSVTAQLPETKVDSSTTETTITTTTITETSQDQKFHGIRKDVTATELLKSKIINEDLYKDLSAGKVTVSEVSEMDTVRRYLEGTNSIAGVYLQSTKETLSIYEAKSRSLLTPGTSLVLLEAQAATGFVIDPVKNKKLSVEEAVAKGVVGTQIATGGIIDPVYSHRVPENLTYLQLVERCIMDPVTGLSLLVIVKKGEFYFFVDEATKLILKSTTTTKAGGKYLGKTVSLWDLLYSKYITEEKRRELVQQYKSGSITIERFLEIILTIIQQQTTTTWSSSTSVTAQLPETKVDSSTTETTITTTTITETSQDQKFHGIRKDVTATELLKSKIINEDLYKDLSAGKVTVSEVSEMDTVRRYLEGTNSIAGVYLQSTKETLSIYEAKSRSLLTPGTSLVLLEAQAATGFVIDPVKNKKLSVEEAVAKGVVGTQIATGGIIDPVYSHRVPENLTYLQLVVERCIMDPVTGLSLLVIVKKGEFYFFVDEATKLILKSTTTTKAGGKYLGKTVSLWDLLYSKYITEEKRRELVQQYKSGSITIERFLEIILTIIQQQTTTTWSSSTSVTAQLPETKVDSSTTETTITTTTITETSQDQKFHGIRKDVTATELLKSKIINEDLYKDLSAGKVTVSEVSEMDTVRRYLEGTNSIAGVYLQSTKETLSIYEAKSRSLLTPGTSLVLLEAQAATGFVIDPVKNKKLSVEEAVAKGVVGTQIATGGIIDPVYSHRVPVQVAYERGYFDEDMNKILSDPDDDTKGFFDPNTQENLTYLQLVERCIMDPVTGLSLLVIVKKGEFYFFVDEATKLILKSTTTTKAGGKYLGKTVSLWDLLYSKYITEEKRRELVQQYKSGSITIERFLEIILTIIQQQTTTTWSSSTSVTAQLPETKVDSSTTETTITTTTITETSQDQKFHGIRKDVTATELLKSKIINEDLYKDLSAGKVTVSEVSEMDTVRRYLEGTNSIAGVYLQSTKETLSIYEAKSRSLLTPGTSLVLLEAQAATGFVIDPVKNKKLSVEEAVAKGVVGTADHNNLVLFNKRHSSTSRNKVDSSTTKTTITTTTITETSQDQKFHGIRKDVTATELLKSKIINEDLYKDLSTGKVTVSEVSEMDTVRRYLEGTNSIAGVYLQSTKETLSIYDAKSRSLLTPGTSLVLLEAQAATGFVIDPVKNKKLSVEEAVAKGVVGNDDTKGFFDPNTQENLTYLQLVERCIMDPVTGLSLLVIVKKGEFYFFVDEATKLILKSTTTTKAGGKYLGKTVSLWDLLYSKYITEEKRRELVQQYKSGSITIERFLEIILTIIQQQTTTTWSSSTSVTAQLPETKVNSSTTETTITTTTITETSQDQKFHGIRKDVTATELLKSKIINEDLYKDLSAGKVTVSEVSKMDTVRRYLEGTNSIAGVYLQSTKETLSIYDAKSRSLLTPGTSLVLLEAQAATGFVIDPVKNKKLSVEEAVAKGVVGSEWKAKLLSAERAVTGYKDPYTGNTISLFQALKKDLIVKDHGIRLLEAQIATGGIIDPVYSHRVPVQVAYERGYFDEDMNKILSDPDDDTKGFFDPNTQENLTYLQLVERCITDPVTGLSLLSLCK
ncbi:hypothetical protein Q5P01_018609 [Channa striata]|uniref:Epiplakin n=1 Tax=Channa striata TaxID=64152 RepID=A0AA88SEA3_CHASR|nr:hypothetical protein Q5P01_018609 [Channa striata]